MRRLMDVYRSDDQEDQDLKQIFKTPAAMSYALGLEAYGDCFQHTGKTPGFATLMRMFPGSAKGAVIFTEDPTYGPNVCESFMRAVATEFNWTNKPTNTLYSEQPMEKMLESEAVYNNLKRVIDTYTLDALGISEEQHNVLVKFSIIEEPQPTSTASYGNK